MKDYAKPVMYCEIDRYAQAVLHSRMQENKLPKAEVWNDVTTLKGKDLPRIDIIYGGFPCQDISVAGNGEGLEGKRSGLFFEIIRLTKECEPRFVFLENVPAIRTRGLDRVLQEFTKIGYDCRWTMLSAADVGANHKRQRWFLLAHSNRNEHRKEKRESIGVQKEISRINRTQDSTTRELGRTSNNECGQASKEHVSNANVKRLERQRKESFRISKKLDNISDKSWWKVEPSVGRVVNELPYRMDRIKCLGNAVVPLQAKTAFERLLNL